MSGLVAGATVKATFGNGTGVVGILADVDGTGALDIQFGSHSLAFTDPSGILKPRWQAATLETVAPPRPAEPTLPGAIVLATSPDTGTQSLFVRLYTGRWRALGGGAYSWASLIDPVVRFEGAAA